MTLNPLQCLLRWPRMAVNVMQRSGVRPSVCPVFFLTLTERARRILTVTRQGAARDVSGTHTVGIVELSL